jgi:hypothetical protein
VGDLKPGGKRVRHLYPLHPENGDNVHISRGLLTPSATESFANLNQFVKWSQHGGRLSRSGSREIAFAILRASSRERWLLAYW